MRDVDRRLDGPRLARPRRGTVPGRDPRGRSTDARVCAADGVPGAAHDRTERGAREEERADDRQQDAEDRAPDRADRERDRPLEAAADGAAVSRAECRLEAGEADGEADAEGAQRDERAAGDDQGAEGHADERREVGRPTDRRRDGVRHRPARKAEPEHAGEEGTGREQAETDELGVVVTARRLTAPLPRARADRALARRHPACFVSGGRPPSRLLWVSFSGSHRRVVREQQGPGRAGRAGCRSSD